MPRPQSGRWRCWLLCVLVCVGSSAQAAQVLKARIWRAPDHTRIVLDLDAPAKYSLQMANNPQRIILTLPHTSLKASLAHLALQKTPIEAVRSTVIDEHELRIVFDLKTPVTTKNFLLKKRDGLNDRLVIDLYDAANDETSTTAKTTNALPTSTTKTKLPPVADESSSTSAAEVSVDGPLDSADSVRDTPKVAVRSARPLLIAIDAGHGGEDTGALGPNSMREKDVTLAIAKELARIINAEKGYSARLTRSTDIYLGLQKRRDMARDMKADLFISIHADSFTDASAYGASVFALSRKGATSEMARFLAQRENESDLIGRVGGVSLDDKDPVLAGVLVDLSMTTTVNASLQLGRDVLRAISGISPLHASHVEQAGFVVLKSPDVPSILVETGFISNAKESKKLASPAYREQMAQAIFKGVKQYAAQHLATAAPEKETPEPKKEAEGARNLSDKPAHKQRKKAATP